MADTQVKKAPQETSSARLIRPACAIMEEDGAVVLELEMPGVRKDGIDVSIDGDTLSVLGHRSAPQGGTYVVRERLPGNFQATYTLDERVDRNKVDARMVNGVLTLTLHLKDEVKPRKIQVKSS